MNRVRHLLPFIVAAGFTVSLVQAQDKSIAAAKAQEYPPLPENV